MRLRQRIRHLVKSTVNSVGLDIIRYVPPTGIFVAARNLLARQGLGTSRPVLFDVGANVGQTVATLRQVWPQGSIYAFEPAPTTFTTLQQAISRHGSGVQAFNLAFGSEESILKLHLNADHQTNSLLGASKDPESVTRDHSAYETHESVDVKVERIDKFCTDHEIQAIDHLKLDAQGYELEILKGCGNMLGPDTIRTISLEILFLPFYEKQAHFHEILALLHSRGYRLFQLFYQDVHNQLGLIQANALFYKAEPTRES